MFESRIPKIIASLAVKSDAVAVAVAELIEADAEDRVPVLTGRLRDAIHVDHEGPGEVAVIAGDNETFYGHIVEHGGAHTPARPFLVPAAEQARAKIPGLAQTLMRGL